MTDEQQAAIDRAVAYGIDISLLEASLRLTPTERVQRGEAFAWFARQVREQGRASREKKSQDAGKPVPDAADDSAE